VITNGAKDDKRAVSGQKVLTVGNSRAKLAPELVQQQAESSLKHRPKIKCCVSSEEKCRSRQEQRALSKISSTVPIARYAACVPNA